MTTYFWSLYNDYGKKTACCNYEKSPNYFDFLGGQPVPPPQKPLIYDVEVGLEKFICFDNLPSNTGLPLVNSRLRALLDDLCPNDVQYLDVEIYYPGGMTTEYQAINITHAVKSLDRERSEYTFFPDSEEIMDIGNLVLLPGCLGEHDIARMEESHVDTLVSQRLLDLFKAHGIKGAHIDETVETLFGGE